MKKIFRKAKTARLPYKQLFAVLMALVMVLSVIYINHKEDRVVADEGAPSVTATDTDFLNGLGISKSNNLEDNKFTVNVPANGVKFALPDASIFDESKKEDVKFYRYTKNENPDKYSLEKIADDDLDGYVLEVDANNDAIMYPAKKKTVRTAAWTGNKTEDNYIVSAASDQVAKIQVYTNVDYYMVDSEGNEDPNPMDGFSTNGSEAVAQITISSYKPSDPSVSGTNDAQNLAFADNDSGKVGGGSGDTRYYGTIEYSLKKGGEAVSADSLSAINGIIGDKTTGTAGDGTYTISKKVTIPKGSDNVEVVYNEEDVATIERNYFVISGYTASIDGSTVDNSTLDSTVHNPKKPVVITINTDKDSATVSCDKDNVTKEGNTFTIPGSLDNNGKKKDYTFTAKDGDVEDSVTINIQYGDGSPKFSSISVDGNPYSGGTIYTKSDITIGASSEVIDTASGAKLDKIQLFKTDSTGAIPDASDDKAFKVEDLRSNNSPSGSASFGFTPSETGNQYYKLRVESDYGIPSVSDIITVCYDNVKPVATKISAEQSSLGYSGSAEFGESTSCEITDKFTAKQAVDLTVKVDDTISGVKSVTFNNNAGTATDSTNTEFTYSLPANASMESGGQDTVTVVVTDLAGNEETYTATINYYNEKISIDTEFSPEVIEHNGANLFKWGEGEKKAYLYYKVTSEVPIAKAEYTVDGGSATELALDTEKSDAANNLYVYKYDFSSVSDGTYTLKFTATNDNGSSSDEVTKVVCIDLTNPAVDNVEIDTAQSIDEGDGTWYQKLFLIVKVSDNLSGVKKVSASGTSQSEYTSFDTNGKFTAQVNESADSIGTKVSFTVVDKAGNSSTSPNYEKTYYVDDTAPVASLTVGGQSSSAVNGKTLSSDPKIEYSVTDSISGLATTDGLTLKIEYGSTTITKTDALDSGKTLSEIINDTLSDTVDYKITLSGKDKAGKEATVLTTTFRVDNTKPVVTGNITTTAVKSNYSSVYNKDVKIDLTAKDSNLQKANIKVTDTVSGKVYSPDWSDITGGYSTSLTFSAEGNYKIEVTATDNAGLVGKWSTSFTIDKTKPDLTTMVDGKVYDKSNDFFSSGVAASVQVEDDNPDNNDVTVTIKRTPFDGNAVTETKTGKGPHSLNDEGKYEITFKVVDKAGNESTKTIGLTVDKSKPIPKIRIVTEALKRDGYYNQASVELSFEISDSTVLPKDVTVTDNDKVVSVNWTSKDGKLTATYTTSSEEKHVVKVAVKDQAGNESSDTRTFVIDRTKPKLTAKVNGKDYNSKDDYFTSNVKTSVIVKDDYEDKSDVTATITCDTFTGDQIVDDYKGKGPYTLKKQGKYTIVYKAVDLAGNERTKTVGLYIDRTKPVGNMYIKSDKPPKFSAFNATYTNKVGKFKSYKDQENYTYGQYYNKSVTIEFSYFDYSVDSITISDGDEEIIPDWTEKNGLGKGTATISDEGHHVITMEIEDKAGNVVEYSGGKKILDFYIDKTAPVVTATVNGSNSSGTMISTNTQGTVNVSVSDANKDPNDITRVVKSTGGGGGTSKVTEGAQSFTNEADYEVQYTAVDKAGNSSAPASVKFRVDKTAPQLSISSNAQNGASSTEVDVSFNIKETFYNDVSSSKIEVYRKVDGENEKHDSTINFMPRSSNDTKTEKFTQDGEYRFVFSATDKAGNQASEKYSFILDGSKPVITLSGVSNYDKTDKQVELGIQVDETFYLTNKVKIEGTRTDMSGDKTDLKFDDFPAASAKIATLTQMFKEDGIYDITVTSTDKAGNSDTQTIHFTIDTKPPVIDDLPEYDGTRVKEFTLDKNLEDLVSDLTVCEVQLYMDGALYDGGTALADGTHVLRIEATDEMGHKSVREFTFVLDTIAPNIIITGAEDGAVLKDATKVNVSVELDEDYLDYVTVNGESLVVSDRQAEVQIDKRGRYTLVAAASDGAGNKSEVTIKFSYGRRFLWLIIGGIAALVLLGGLLLLLGKRRGNRR
ncbi:MAG: Ig-like domain repeat protein [Eubacterium sp.]|nr:Ig-like domain repeat protein [Eubacterium sp.]